MDLHHPWLNHRGNAPLGLMPGMGLNASATPVVKMEQNFWAKMGGKDGKGARYIRHVDRKDRRR